MAKTRYNFLLSQMELEKWQTFSKDYGLSMSSLIRLSVNDYIKKKEKENAINQIEQGNINTQRDRDEKMDRVESKINNIESKLVAEEEAKKNFEQRDRLKAQTMAILKKFPNGLTNKELSELLALDRIELNNFLLYLSDSSLINKKKGIVTLRQ
jgi:hypothetical protein